jgi:glutamate-1-semialdehyde 2,1-aminomutase
VLVFNHCYHGSVDEAFVTLDSGARPRSRPGNVGPAVDPTITTRVCEFNDVEALERLLADEQVACVLAEPALTNVGIVLPEDGFHDALRAACDRTGTLLIIDETHTISGGPGGCTAAWGLRPDVVTIGKAIAGGIPIGAYGVSAELGDRIAALDEADLVDVGGVGGTLAGNALSLAAARATLEEVLTPAAFEGMFALRERYVDGVREVLADGGIPWTIVSLGARAELAFAPDPPRTGGASAALFDTALEDALHLFLLNRGVMITPFHNMALMSPATTAADVDRHTEVFGEAVAALVR